MIIIVLVIFWIVAIILLHPEKEFNLQLNISAVFDKSNDFLYYKPHEILINSMIKVVYCRILVLKLSNQQKSFKKREKTVTEIGIGKLSLYWEEEINSM